MILNIRSFQPHEKEERRVVYIRNDVILKTVGKTHFINENKLYNTLKRKIKRVLCNHKRVWSIPDSLAFDRGDKSLIKQNIKRNIDLLIIGTYVVLMSKYTWTICVFSVEST